MLINSQKKRLVKIKDYCLSRFEEHSAPDVRVVRGWIDDGVLAGKRMGHHYYVEVYEDGSEVDGTTGGAYYG